MDQKKNSVAKKIFKDLVEGDNKKTEEERYLKFEKTRKHRFSNHNIDLYCMR